MQIRIVDGDDSRTYGVDLPAMTQLMEGLAVPAMKSYIDTAPGMVRAMIGSLVLGPAVDALTRQGVAIALTGDIGLDLGRAFAAGAAFNLDRAWRADVGNTGEGATIVHVAPDTD